MFLYLLSGFHFPRPISGYSSGWDYISLALPRAIIRILSSSLKLKASFRSLVEKSLRDPVGIRTQDPQLRRLLLYPAELPDHPLMDFRPSLRSHPLGVFYAWLSHTKHHAQTYAYAICDCKGSAFSRLHQTKSQLFFLTRHFLQSSRRKTK